MAKLFPAGLARPESFARYIKETDRIVQTWNTLDTASKRKQAIEALLKQFSQANGLPAPQFTATPMSASLLGTFTFKTWQLELNASTLRPDMTPRRSVTCWTRCITRPGTPSRTSWPCGSWSAWASPHADCRAHRHATRHHRRRRPQTHQPAVRAGHRRQRVLPVQLRRAGDQPERHDGQPLLRRSEWEIAKDELRYLESRRQEVVQFQKEATSAAEKPSGNSSSRPWTRS